MNTPVRSCSSARSSLGLLITEVDVQVLPLIPKAARTICPARFLPFTPPSLLLTHSAPATQASWLFLQHTRPIAAPGPLHGPCLLPRGPFPLGIFLDHLPLHSNSYLMAPSQLKPLGLTLPKTENLTQTAPDPRPRFFVLSNEHSGTHLMLSATPWPLGPSTAPSTQLMLTERVELRNGLARRGGHKGENPR